MYHKMVIFSDTFSILPPATVLENCLETPGDVCQIEVFFTCSIGIFSDTETLELQAVSLSFEDLLPRLTFSCFYFICGTVPLLFTM